ncbi:MAG: hypothetical protein AB2687_04555, partial [Candidatus Thiodiazotropha taylori]
NVSHNVKENINYFAEGRSLKDGPVICQSEDFLLEDNREKKDLTLAELNHVFKMYLQKRGIRKKDISILGQFSLLFNDPMFSDWHTLSKSEQSDSLSDQVIFPQVYDELIMPLGETAGDAETIKGVVKDAVQNAIDSFSHAAFIQKKFISRFPGVKIILFMDQANKRMILAVVDNGFGAKITKPKKSHLGEEYGDDIASRLVDWVIRRFIEKEEGEIRHDIAYTGGQGMAFKKLKLELRLDVDIHFLASGAVFELRLNTYF